MIPPLRRALTPRWIFMPFFLAVLLLPAWPARAVSCPSRPADPGESRKLASRMYRRGLGLFDLGRYQDALRFFQCANRLVPASLTRYWIARSAEAVGRHRLALRAYRSLLPHPPAAVSHAELKQRICNMKKRLASARRRPSRPVPRLPPPGSRPITPALKRHRTLRLAGWSALGAGIALLIAGGVAGGIYLRNRNDFENPGDNVYWDPDGIELQMRLKNLSIVSWTLMGAGAAAVIAGGVLLFLGRTRERGPRVGVAPLPGGGWVSLSLSY